MINERGLCRAMKSAYRSGGYEVAGGGEENTLYINGYSWYVAAPQKQMPRKMLALLVEHVGCIPTGEAFRVHKNDGAQAIVLSMALQTQNGWAKLLDQEDATEIRQTAMTWKGWNVWQKTETGTVLAFDGDLTALGFGKPALHGNALVWDEAGELVCVLPGKDVLDMALRELLEQTMLTGE